MKLKMFIVFVLVFGFYANGFTQSKNDCPDSTVFQKHSLQFRVSNIFTLSSFKGALLSYKYHFSDKHAFRIGLDLDSKLDESDDTNDFYGNDTSNSGKTINQTYYDFFVVGEYLFYINPLKDVKLFLGLGPQLKLYKSGQKSDKIFNSDTSASYSYLKEGIRKNSEFGISSVYGIEWFFRSNMSLHAEYSFSIVCFMISKSSHNVSVSRYYENDVVRKTSYDDKGYIFRSNSARLGLSVYL